MPNDELRALADRPGWAVAGSLAMYEPNLGGWRAVVRPVKVAGRSYERWHVAVVDPAGHAHLALTASTVAEARRVAEGQVLARN